MARVYCEECSWSGDDGDCNGIHHIHERVDVGGTMPGGCCPRCGALCYPRRFEPWTAEGKAARYEMTLQLTREKLSKLLAGSQTKGRAAERRMIRAAIGQIDTALDCLGRRHVALNDGTSHRANA